jgi:hypothetical protein
MEEKTWEERVQEFNREFQELQEKHMITLKPSVRTVVKEATDGGNMITNDCVLIPLPLRE